MSLGVTVTTSETSGASTPALSTGTAFFVGLADSGPSTPVLLRSLSEYIALFGPRTTTSAILYDAVNAFFALKGARCYVLRVTNAGAKTAELTLTDSASKPTLLVKAKYPGVLGNTIKIEVATESSEAEIKILNGEGELLETSGKLKTQAAIIEWSEKHATYVVITQSEASEHTSNLPKTASPKALTGGVNPTSVTDAECVAALPAFQGSLGPGLVAAPGRHSEAMFLGLAEHAQQHNRFAWGDLEDETTTSAVISAKGTNLTVGVAGYIGFSSSSVIVQGVASGTTRTVAGSAIVAALCAQVAATGNDNQAPAGINWPLEPFVVGFTKTWSKAEMETLNAAGINSFAERTNVLCLYGFVTALLPSQDEVFWQASATRERMSLVYRAAAIGERYVFSTLDGRGQTIAKFQGALQGLIAEDWLDKALFGGSAPEAGEVNVGEPINTLKTMQEGKLNAQMIVRISPFAQAVAINIVTAPITESV